MKQATGLHFNILGHSLDNLKVTDLEKVNYVIYRKEWKTYLIRKLNTLYRRLNTTPWLANIAFTLCDKKVFIQQLLINTLPNIVILAHSSI